MRGRHAQRRDSAPGTLPRVAKIRPGPLLGRSRASRGPGAGRPLSRTSPLALHDAIELEQDSEQLFHATEWPHVGAVAERLVGIRMCL
jgi:hypothetical protein